MYKYFVVSDVHSFYTPLTQALKKAGFHRTNKEHILIICGDVFDRGSETNEVYEFICSIPKDRRILIKGNHEYLFQDLLTKSFPDSYDFSNGTVRTFCDIAKYKEEVLDSAYWRTQARREGYDAWFYENKPYEYWGEIKQIVQNSKITKWIYSKEWKNYYELGRYIFVHSFIPTKIKDNYEQMLYWMPRYSLSDECFEYDPNWRQSNDWYDAVWGCPWSQYLGGLFAPEQANGKILVCGHWHAYDFRIHLDGVKYKDKTEIDFTTYKSDNIIALDACTVVSHICNVFTFIL